MFITQEVKRVNLICHGLMWFWRHDKNHLKILIPAEKVHVYKIGSVYGAVGDPPSQKNLKDLKPSQTLTLKGVLPGGMTPGQMAADFALPVIKRSMVKRNGNALIEIEVPIPDLIRSYCHAETYGIPMIGKGQKGAVALIPSGVSIVFVLSWVQASGQAIELSDDKDRYLPHVSYPYANLSIYAQEEDPNMKDPEHGKSFNNLVYYQGTQAMTLAATSPDLVPDAPPASTAIGVTEADLRALSDWFGSTTDRTGCVGAVVPDES